MISFSSVYNTMNITANLGTIFAAKVTVWRPSLGAAVQYRPPACLRMSSLAQSTSVLE